MNPKSFDLRISRRSSFATRLARALLLAGLGGAAACSAVDPGPLEPRESSSAQQENDAKGSADENTPDLALGGQPGASRSSASVAIAENCNASACAEVSCACQDGTDLKVRACRNDVCFAGQDACTLAEGRLGKAAGSCPAATPGGGSAPASPSGGTADAGSPPVTPAPPATPSPPTIPPPPAPPVTPAPTPLPPVTPPPPAPPVTPAPPPRGTSSVASAINCNASACAAVTCACDDGFDVLVRACENATCFTGRQACDIAEAKTGRAAGSCKPR